MNVADTTKLQELGKRLAKLDESILDLIAPSVRERKEASF
jgi:hypothetical protein